MRPLCGVTTEDHLLKQIVAPENDFATRTDYRDVARHFSGLFQHPPLLTFHTTNLRD